MTRFKQEIDFERASLLLHIIVEAGKHGPVFQRLASEAGNELKQMIQDLDPKVAPEPQYVTPAAGPPNGLVRNEAGDLVENKAVTQPPVVVNPPPAPVPPRQPPHDYVNPRPAVHPAPNQAPAPPVVERRLPDGKEQP